MTLKQAIGAKGWSVCHASRISGVDRRTLHRIMEGRFFPSIETARKLAAVFGCELEYHRLLTKTTEVVRCYDITTT